MSRRPGRDRWREIDELFTEALALPPERWPSFLDERCGDDEVLRRSVAKLLLSDEASRHFLDGSARDVVPEAFVAALRRGVDRAAPRDRTGERIGPWRIVRRLGRGGMAGVFLVRRVDGEFEQTAAIKFLRRGLDSDDFVRRFRAERQILSSLHHPNIARLIDGGTTASGLPYLVLEHVNGVPITDYCDELRCSIEERLRLFREAARAVQHAHSNLVIHRDIKPSNILVTPEGQVKLLDFGIAKLLDPDADPTTAVRTRTGHRPLTPEYASPEQVRGEPVTTASDVYQLGVLLYRLLTGARPYGSSATGETLEESITRIVPPVPSAAAGAVDGEVAARRATTPERLRRRVRGDLDVIVMKALRKEPARRYASVVELAEDVRRHLEGRPILARPESRLYRARKFLKRNRWVAPVAAVVTILLSLYVGTLIRHGRQLEEERDVARDVQAAFVSFFTAPDSTEMFGLGEGRRDLTVREAILDGVDRMRSELADRPAARAQVLGAMAEVLADLDDSEQAFHLAQEALELEASLHGEASPEFHETLLLVGILTADPDSARALLGRRLELSRSLYGETHRATATSLEHLGALEARTGHLEEAARLYERSLRLRRASDSVPPPQLAWALGRLAETHLALGRTDEAVRASREAYEIMRTELGERHSSTATHGVKLAGALRDAGDTEGARTMFETSLATLDEELGATHGTTLASRGNFALLLLQLDDYQAAEEVQRRLLRSLRERYGDGSPEVAATMQNLAVNLKEQNRYAEADSLATAAYEILREDPGDGHYRTAFPLLTLAEIRLTVGNHPGAETASREATRILRATLPADHYATAVAECRWGRALAGQGRIAEARPLLDAAGRALSSVERAGTADYREECLTALAAIRRAG